MEKNLIDFHSHIMPGVDHGSGSLETTLYQLRLAESFGVKRIISTSHFYPHVHTVKPFLEKRNSAYQRVLDAGIAVPEIKLAAEVLLCENLHRLDGLSELCISGTDYLLLELPFKPLTKGLISTVKELVNGGFDVILAHADRYPKERIESLFDFGVSLQLNTDSLSRFFRREELFEWIKSDRVVALGSDIHGKDKSAYKRFLKAIDKIGEDFIKINKKSNEIWERALHC